MNSPGSASPQTPPEPLYVDLDGSLLATDSFHEGLVLAAASKPWLLFAFPAWLTLGKAPFKARVAAAAHLDPTTLPYRDSVVAHVKAARDAGRRVILATGAAAPVAEGVARHLGLFDAVLSSSETENLTGARKLAAIERHAGGPFQYLGNSAKDLPVWRRATAALTADAPANVLATLEREGIRPTIVAPRSAPALAKWLRAIRVHQWAKNLLMFVPAFTAHVWLDPTVLSRLVVAFFAFSLLASSIYLINDMVDLANDRSHASKRHRPFAAGTLPILHGALLVPVLILTSLLLAARLPTGFQLLVATYLVSTTLYSFWLKRVVALDTVLLASLYTIRIAAGGAAIAVTVSPWLFAFSMFLFLSLALIKRAAELLAMTPGGDLSIKGRGYRVTDLDAVVSLGSASAYASVVVLTLYVNGSAEARTLYQRPALLYLICPILLYWVTRMWILARRGEVREDPVVFAIRDRVSYLVLMAMGLVTFLAT